MSGVGCRVSGIRDRLIGDRGCATRMEDRLRLEAPPSAEVIRSIVNGSLLEDIFSSSDVSNDLMTN